MSYAKTMFWGAITAVALTASAVQAEEEGVQLLFVQTAAGMQAGDGQLRLVGVGEQTVYFSDRPYRVAGHLHLDRFVNGWSTGDDSFAVNPPNAVLSVYGAEVAEENALVVIELASPVIEEGDLLYSYKIVDGEMPAEGGATSLFIDTFGPGGGVGAGYHGVGVGRRGPGAAGWAGVAVRNCNDGDC
ncbi:hypothetical protein LCL97_11725 [Seohaeicola saemankumensis]|nr:hypothetical protein [Seohaeicola saemankumensis]MCA0871498.1 hypothetical protein [Seohaeicola saemankumensis]